MICPKCGYDNREQREDCQRCGVIFAKIKERPMVVEGDPELLEQRGDQVCEYRDPEQRFYLWGRGLVLLGMTVWGPLPDFFRRCRQHRRGERAASG